MIDAHAANGSASLAGVANALQPSPATAGISVVIIAQDEEANIAPCLASVRWADEVVVVDGGSRDQTVELASSLGAHVYQNPWPGFSAQWNVAIEHASRDWVFVLAADERVTDELAEQVLAVAMDDVAFDAYYVLRQTSFLDHAMRGCGWGDQPELRLFRRGRGRMDGRLVHERLIVDGPVGELTGHLLHYSHPTVRDYLENMNRCTSLEAQEALALRQRGSWLPPTGPLLRAGRRWLAGDRSYQSAHAALKDELKNRYAWTPLQPFAPLLRFLQMYLLQRGFRDGRHGLYLSLLSATYVLVKQIKLWELRSSAAVDANTTAGAQEAVGRG
ncbi:MAG: glycosyltransferase family 2 protein [Dehalococcoidia bacterium]